MGNRLSADLTEVAQTGTFRIYTKHWLEHCQSTLFTLISPYFHSHLIKG